MTNKKPLLWDFVYGITGTFMRMQEHEAGVVRLWYVPFNSFKEQQYPDLIPLKSLLFKKMSRADIAGVSEDMVLIMENIKGECRFKAELGDIYKENVVEIQRRLEEEQMAKYTHLHRAHTAKKETQKQVAQDLQLRKKLDGENNQSPFGFNRIRPFGTPFGRNSGDDDEYDE